MKKYKHRKTGIIATNEFNCCDGGYYQVDNREIVKSFFIEDSLDWEEIIEYPVGTKVLDTFSNEHKYTYIKQKNGKWALGTQDYFNIDEKSIGENKRFKLIEEVVEKDYEILKKDSYPCMGAANAGYYQVITSIRRLSDGEIFSVGDEITHAHNKPGVGIITRDYKIEKIYFIEENRLSFYVGEGLNLGINSIKKQPLFTTDFEVIDWVNDKENFHIGNTILSVKRKSDNVQFKIGDRIKEGTIIKIIIKKDKIYLEV